MPELDISAKWRENFPQGSSHQIGILTLDVAGHSKWKGNQADIEKTKVLLKKFVINIISLYNGFCMKWEGDGGIFVFSLDSEAKGEIIDTVVICCEHLKVDIKTIFNRHNNVWNKIKSDFDVRLCVHVGSIVTSGDISTANSKAVNYIAKAERKIGESGKITLTNDAYDVVMIEEIKNSFSEALCENLEESSAGKVVVYRTEKINYPSDNVFENKLATAISNTLDNKSEYEIKKLKKAVDGYIKLVHGFDRVPFLDILQGNISRMINENNAEMTANDDDDNDPEMLKGEPEKAILLILTRGILGSATETKKKILGDIEMLLKAYLQYEDLPITDLPNKIEIIFNSYKEDNEE